MPHVNSVLDLLHSSQVSPGTTKFFLSSKSPNPSLVISEDSFASDTLNFLIDTNRFIILWTKNRDPENRKE